MIKEMVTAHVGSYGKGTYKVVTGELVDYVTRTLETGRHYVTEALIMDAEGVMYRTGVERIIETNYVEVEEVMEEQTETPETEPETVWVPVGKVVRGRRDEVELTWAQIWQVRALVARYRSQRRGHENFEAMRTVKEWRELGLGLTDREVKDVANWSESEEVTRERVAAGVRAVEALRASRQ
jgi:hypothetical protein